jgi:hypothetical protein
MAAGEEARLLEEGLGAAAVGLQVGTPLNHRGQQGRAFDREEDDEHSEGDGRFDSYERPISPGPFAPPMPAAASAPDTHTLHLRHAAAEAFSRRPTSPRPTGTYRDATASLVAPLPPGIAPHPKVGTVSVLPARSPPVLSPAQASPRGPRAKGYPPKYFADSAAAYADSAAAYESSLRDRRDDAPSRGSSPRKTTERN